jgi:hypothetical protein
MGNRFDFSDNRGRKHERSGNEPALSSDTCPCSVAAPSEEHDPDCFEGVLAFEPMGCWQEPMTADELLAVNGKAFEPLFHGPHLGPVPEYLTPHLRVHGCVGEYEEQVEELERWKSHQLARWLEDRSGRLWRIAGSVYELQADAMDAGTCRFSMRLVEDRSRSGRSADDTGRGRYDGNWDLPDAVDADERGNDGPGTRG